MGTNQETLKDWGWDPHRDRALAESGADGEPGRVVASDRGGLVVRLADATLRGLWRPARREDDGAPPAVGDWCVIHRPEGDAPALVHTRLPRRSSIVRKAPGRSAAAQVVAANVDTAALVCGLDRSQGVRSLERLLTLVLDGGAMPLIVLNKVDLCDDVETQVLLAQQAAPGFDVLSVSAADGTGIDDLRHRLAPGSTVVLLGPSGVGKSSLVNALSGAPVTVTGDVRESDRRGRHTTTRRQLHRMPGGALLLDTPGLRELAAWVEGDGLREAFADIEAFAAACRFRDCTHDNEPGCAVREALDRGELEARRFVRYLELVQEARSLAERRERRNRGNAKRRFKDISRAVRRLKRDREKP